MVQLISVMVESNEAELEENILKVLKEFGEVPCNLGSWCKF